jgi:CRP-like cAMP-binding protein
MASGLQRSHGVVSTLEPTPAGESLQWAFSFPPRKGNEDRSLVKPRFQRKPVSSNERPANNLLRRLANRDYALIAPHIDSIDLAPDAALYNSGDDFDALYFPSGPSLVSFVLSLEDGRDVQAVLIGREGVIGGFASRSALANARIVVKVGGPFYRLRASKFEAARRQSPSFLDVFARYSDCLLAQAFQSAACNAAHSIEQRAAKWILATMERTGETFVPLTHEQLATMVGVGRSYASRVLKAFKAAAILETRRGSIIVHDRRGLDARSCDCNAWLRDYFDEVLNGVYPKEA